MAGQSKIVPTLHDLQGLPRSAQVALCARAAVQRASPAALSRRLAQGAGQVPGKHRSVNRRRGTRRLTRKTATANLNKAGHAAMKVYGTAPDKITFSKEYVDDVPYAASRVAFAGLENDAGSVCGRSD